MSAPLMSIEKPPLHVLPMYGPTQPYVQTLEKTDRPPEKQINAVENV